jgi:micrococcal nuclease
LFLVALALLCIFVLGCSSRFVSDQLGGEEAGVTVVRVTDGDSVRITPEVDGKYRVRLIGVDTPETDPERRPEPYGEEAARFTQRSLEDQNVTLEFDVEREDDYGRFLSYAYLPDGSMFN